MSPTTSGIVASSRILPATDHDPRLYNDDLAPTTAAQRTWGTYNYIALWFSMSMEVTTYMLASSLIAGGMNWKQAIFTILLGNLIVLVPMLLNAHAGAKYGIPFPVFVRASFGTRGANLPAMLRALVACGWFGIQSWLGGQAIAAMLAVLWPATAHMPCCLARPGARRSRKDDQYAPRRTPSTQGGESSAPDSRTTPKSQGRFRLTAADSCCAACGARTSETGGWN